MNIVFNKNKDEILGLYHAGLTRAFGTDAPKYRLDKITRALEDEIAAIVIDCSNSSDDEIAELISDINSIIDVRLKCYSPDLVRTLKFIIIQNIG